MTKEYAIRRHLHHGSWRDLLTKYTRIDHHLHDGSIKYFGHMTDDELHSHFGWCPEFDAGMNREETIEGWVENMWLSLFQELRDMTGDNFPDEDGYENIIFWANKVEAFYSKGFDDYFRYKESSSRKFDSLTDDQINLAVNS